MMYIQFITALILAALFPTGFASGRTKEHQQRQLQVSFTNGDQCRCEASWETFYTARRQLAVSQQKADEHIQDASARQLQYFNYSSIGFSNNLFTVDGVHVLPPTAPQCRGISSRNKRRNLRRRVPSNVNDSRKLQSTTPSPRTCETAPNGVPLCCFSDSASTCDCDCPAIPETFDCPVSSETTTTTSPTSNIVTASPTKRTTAAPTMQIVTETSPPSQSAPPSTSPSPTVSTDVTQPPTTNMITGSPTTSAAPSLQPDDALSSTPTSAPLPTTTSATPSMQPNAASSPTTSASPSTRRPNVPSASPIPSAAPLAVLSSAPSFFAASATPSMQPNNAGSPSLSPTVVSVVSTQSPTSNTRTMQPTTNMITAMPTVVLRTVTAPTPSPIDDKTRAPYSRKPIPATNDRRPTDSPTMNVITGMPTVADDNLVKTRAPVVRKSIPGVWNGGGFYYK